MSLLLSSAESITLQRNAFLSSLFTRSYCSTNLIRKKDEEIFFPQKIIISGTWFRSRFAIVLFSLCSFLLFFKTRRWELSWSLVVHFFILSINEPYKYLEMKIIFHVGSSQSNLQLFTFPSGDEDGRNGRHECLTSSRFLFYCNQRTLLVTPTVNFCLNFRYLWWLSGCYWIKYF